MSYLLLINSQFTVCQRKMALEANSSLHSYCISNGWLIWITVVLIMIGQSELTLLLYELDIFVGEPIWLLPWRSVDPYAKWSIKIFTAGQKCQTVLLKLIIGKCQKVRVVWCWELQINVISIWETCKLFDIYI